MGKMRLFLSYLLLIIFLCICSCASLEESPDKDFLFVRIRNDGERKIMEQFVVGKNEYVIKGDVIICSDLKSKIALKRHLVLNDFGSFGTISSYYHIDFYYNSDGTYLPKGTYRILVRYCLAELKGLVLSDYINDSDFKDVDETFPEMHISLPNYDLYDKLKLEDILSYFKDGRLYGWGQEANDYMVYYESEEMYNELNVDFTTLVIYLIDQGYSVTQDDESGALVIISN